MFYIRDHRIPFQTNLNGDPIAIVVTIPNGPTLPITTVPDSLCFIYSMNCCPKKRKRKKKKEKGKRSRAAKSVETHGSTDIFTSAPGSISKLDVHSRTSPQLQNT